MKMVVAKLLKNCRATVLRLQSCSIHKNGSALFWALAFVAISLFPRLYHNQVDEMLYIWLSLFVYTPLFCRRLQGLPEISWAAWRPRMKEAGGLDFLLFLSLSSSIQRLHQETWKFSERTKEKNLSYSLLQILLYYVGWCDAWEWKCESIELKQSLYIPIEVLPSKVLWRIMGNK